MCKWEWEGPLGALAAAYAEAGDFASAVKWQTKAVAAVKQHNSFNHDFVKEHETRLALYQERKPYRLSVSAN
jgi:hypothetical protein